MTSTPTQKWTSPVSNKEYELKRFTLGEKSDIYDDSQELIQGVIPAMSTRKLRVNTIVRGVASPKLTEQEVAGMDNAEGMILYAAIEAYNAVPLPSTPKPSSSTKEDAQPKI